MVCLWAGSQTIPQYNIYVAIGSSCDRKQLYFLLVLAYSFLDKSSYVACVMVKESSVVRIMICTTSLCCPRRQRLWNHHFSTTFIIMKLLYSPPLLLASCQPFSIIYGKQRSFHHEVITFASFGRNACLQGWSVSGGLPSLLPWKKCWK